MRPSGAGHLAPKLHPLNTLDPCPPSYTLNTLPSMPQTWNSSLLLPSGGHRVSPHSPHSSAHILPPKARAAASPGGEARAGGASSWSGAASAFTPHSLLPGSGSWVGGGGGEEASGSGLQGAGCDSGWTGPVQDGASGSGWREGAWTDDLYDLD